MLDHPVASDVVRLQVLWQRSVRFQLQRGCGVRLDRQQPLSGYDRLYLSRLCTALQQECFRPDDQRPHIKGQLSRELHHTFKVGEAPFVPPAGEVVCGSGRFFHVRIDGLREAIQRSTRTCTDGSPIAICADVGPRLLPIRRRAPRFSNWATGDRPAIPLMFSTPRSQMPSTYPAAPTTKFFLSSQSASSLYPASLRRLEVFDPHSPTSEQYSLSCTSSADA